MKYTIIYFGMDVHKESFTLACCTNEKKEAVYFSREPKPTTVKSSVIWKPSNLFFYSHIE